MTPSTISEEHYHVLVKQALTKVYESQVQLFTLASALPNITWPIPEVGLDIP